MNKCLLFSFILISALTKGQSPADSLKVDSVRMTGYHEASRIEDFKKGYRDAELYYYGSRKANRNTLITTIIYSPVGLIPAIKNSRKDIEDTELNIPHKELADNLDYYLGYKLKAEKIKKKKIWNRFLLGFGIEYLAIIIIGVAVNK